ncbi:DUF5753 domain-containing protein [Actinocorallia sp. A-T 12471]|uniref:DUF5753 domain-containing protein n=1 Tax=Actinocorallia sp. A-T 12471 TaxID=3089813 RepID=UPI0029CCFAD9|nr:DUF5753 domain-containing protein [Actinocorallia sp. A-T 12471]MDX6743807.1 DUF5753 domain-containing protein [Actinocorallia sp. A-T 12471]
MGVQVLLRHRHIKPLRPLRNLENLRHTTTSLQCSTSNRPSPEPNPPPPPPPPNSDSPPNTRHPGHHSSPNARYHSPRKSEGVFGDDVLMSGTGSSSARVARVRLGGRLRRVREGAGVSGVEFARRAGWASSAMVTMVEKGQKAISAEHVRLWCRVCGVGEQGLAELLAEQAAVAGMWATHAELNAAGLRARQERVRDEYWQVRVHRVYQTRVPPGLLQTRGMMAYLLTRVRLEQRVALDDVAEAVEARFARQECLRRPDARWLFLLEEDVLWYRLAPVEVHREQLRHLLEMMRYPTVSLGVIPRTAERLGAVAGESFSMNDRDLVSVELISGYLNFTMAADVQLYVEAWERFARIAVHGERARALIHAALEALDLLSDDG